MSDKRCVKCGSICYDCEVGNTSDEFLRVREERDAARASCKELESALQHRNDAFIVEHKLREEAEAELTDANEWARRWEGFASELMREINAERARSANMLVALQAVDEDPAILLESTVALLTAALTPAEPGGVGGQ